MNDTNRIENPRLSVVVASHNGRESLSRCLTELGRQRDSGVAEIIVVDNSTDGSAEIIRRDFSDVRLFEADGKRLIPELWGIGIELCTAEIVALTTTHFVPAKTWASEILKAHESPEAGIGGAIENDEHADIVSWAVYFCRYSPYMLPFPAQTVDDFAADNASYKKRDLDSVKETMASGFWETFVHREMRRRGLSLTKSPEIMVHHQKSFDFAGFMSQRFHHGRQFGSARASDMPLLRRAAFVLLSPAVPFLYLFRITKRVLEKRRNIGRLAVSMPVLVMFLLSWSAGEFTGYLLDQGE